MEYCATISINEEPKRWKTSSTSVYNLGDHLLWCPKYRPKAFVVVSDGLVVDNPKHLKKYQNKLRGAQRSVSRKKVATTQEKQ